MTNKQTSDEIYIKLREFLDQLPPGFSATRSGIDIEYLKWIFGIGAYGQTGQGVG